MPRSLLTVLLALVVAGCAPASDVSPTSSTTPPRSAVDTVAGWLGALDAGDAGAATAQTDGISLALMVGAENPMAVADLAAMVVGGVGETTGRTYWDTFRADFAMFAGVGIGAIEVGGSEEFVANDDRFSAVTIGGPGRTSEVVCRLDPNGNWTVDLVATVGPSLVRALRNLVVDLPSGPDGDIVRAAFVQRASSLQAGLDRAPGDALPDAFRIELEALIGYLASLG